MSNFSRLTTLAFLTTLLSAVSALSVLAQEDTDAPKRSNPFAELDSNEDGALNYEEFSARPARLLDEADSNGDGMLSAEELHEHQFLRLDRDGDGLLTPGELRPRRMQGNRPARGEQGTRGENQARGEFRNRQPR